MVSSEFDNRTQSGFAKADMNMYRDLFSIVNLATLKKHQTDFAQAPKSNARQVKGNQKPVIGLRKVKGQQRCDAEGALVADKMDKDEYKVDMTQMEFIKQELSKLDLEMASVIKQKSLAEAELEASNTKIWSNSAYAKILSDRIHDASEESVLHELARIEAQVELETIEAKREREFTKYSSQLAQTERKTKDLNINNQINLSKELETKLPETLMDIHMLRDELDQVKRISLPQVEKLEKALLLQTVSDELQVAKEELGFIKQEGFKYMTAMDIIRNELRHVKCETSQLRKSETEARFNLQKLDSQLLRAKHGLDIAISAQEKEIEMVSSLSQSLQRLNIEANAANKETEFINENIISMSKAKQKAESNIKSTEAKLHDALQELEKVKSSESKALDKLKALASNQTRPKESSSIVTISKSEYLHLTEREFMAKQIAGMKIEAARALIRALKNSKKEKTMKIKLRHKEMTNLRIQEEIQVYDYEASIAEKQAMETELRKLQRKHEDDDEDEEMVMQIVASSCVFSRSSKAATAGRRRTRCKKSVSPLIRYMPRSNSLTIRRRIKVVPNLSKLLSIKRVQIRC